MKAQNLEALFLSELKDVFNAEQQMIKALPKAMRAADSEDLALALEDHLEETQQQIERLKEIFRFMEMPTKGTPCRAMQGLVEECAEVMEEWDKSALRDEGIITKCQRIEHYEIASYESLILFAERLDLDRAVDLLKETLQEEINANKKLAVLAQGRILSMVD